VIRLSLKIKNKNLTNQYAPVRISKGVKKWIFYSVVLAFCLAAKSFAAETVVTEPLDGEHDQFCADLLAEILNYGDKRYRLNHQKAVSTQNRDIANLEKNRIDITWIATSKDYEKRLLPIRIPIFKGLLGHRLLVVKKSQAVQLSRVKTLQDLRQFRMGQGLGWFDSDILRANGFSVHDAQNHDLLYSMLSRGRYDVLPRGLHEPWEEIESYPYADLIVEESLLIHYPLPMYFFVNRNNQALADTISENFERFIDDGRFDEFFYKHPKIHNALQRAQLSGRRIFHLSNPYLPPETPLEIQKYWFDAEQQPAFSPK
jgi:hypothetical protein